MRNEEKRLLELLPFGKAEALKSDKIADMANIRDPRTFRHSIELLRREGAIICSCGRGLYRPDNREEVREWLKATKARIKSIQDICTSAERLLDQIPGQQSLNIEDGAE